VCFAVTDRDECLEDAALNSRIMFMKTRSDWRHAVHSRRFENDLPAQKELQNVRFTFYLESGFLLRINDRDGADIDALLRPTTVATALGMLTVRET
jgi:hypothetical protein